MAGSSDRRSQRKRRRDRERLSREKTESLLSRSFILGTPVDESFILELNRLLLQHSQKYAPSAGRYRSTSVIVKWGGKVVYRPPEAQSLPALMRNFFGFLSEPGDITNIEIAGRACLYLLKAHPFREGNGRTARAVATYLLLRKGYTARPHRSIETYIDANAEEYYAKLLQSNDSDFMPWLGFFKKAVGSAFWPPGRQKSRARLLSSAAMGLRKVLTTHLA